LNSGDEDVGSSDYDDDAPTPKPCCFPGTWQGWAVHELAVGSRSRADGRRGSTGPLLSRAYDQFFVDGANKRLAGNKVHEFATTNSVPLFDKSIVANKTVAW